METLKLKFNKETVANLTSNEMSDVKGGFSYALSAGRRCQYSNKTIKDSEYRNANDCKVTWKESTKVEHTVCQ